MTVRRNAFARALLALGLAGAAQGCVAAPSRTGADTTPVTVSAISYSVRGRPGGDQLAEFARQVADDRSAALSVDIVPGPDNSKADSSNKAIDLVRGGDVDLGIVAARTFDTLGVKAFQAFQAPGLVTSQALADSIIADDVSQAMLPSVEPLGLTGVGLAYDSLQYPLGYRAPLLGPTTYAGKSLAVRPSVATTELVAALGATPDPRNGPELETAAARAEVHGAFESLEVPTSPVRGGTVTANTPMFLRVNVLVVNTKVWRGLTDRQRSAILHAAAGTARWAAQQHVPVAAAAAQYCADGNGDVVLASAAEKEALRSAFAPVYARMRAESAIKAAMNRFEQLADAASSDPTPAPCRRFAGTPGATSAPLGDQTALDGVWRWTWTRPFLVDHGIPAGDASNNAGTWTLTMKSGKYNYVEPKGRECAGSYVLHGGRIVMTETSAGCDGVWAFAWTRGDEKLRLDPVEDSATGVREFRSAFLAAPLIKIGDAP